MTGPEQIKQVIDTAAAAGTLAAVMQWVPPVTAVLTLIWVSIRIIETKTIQNIIKRLREKK